MLKNKQTGFTIVELLIVIVVIGILAAITVVAYNGIQSRATNTARVAAARQALGVVQAYKAVNGDYPALPDNPSSTLRAACIGTDWPLMEGQSVCWNIYTDGNGPTSSTFLESSDINDQLATIGMLPNYPKKIVGTVQGSDGRNAGIAALALIEHPAGPSSYFPKGYALAYVLKGGVDDVECGLGGAVKTELRPAITRCVVTLD